jgi:hypothetical protein
VGLPLLHVLATQPWHEGSPQLGVNVLKLRAGNRERHTRTEMTKATDVSRDWAVLGCYLDKMLDNLLPVFAGQTMKHRQMCCQKIPLRRKVLLAKTIKWLEVVVANACREDQGLERFQETRPSMCVLENEIELRLFGTILVGGQR